MNNNNTNSVASGLSNQFTSGRWLSGDFNQSSSIQQTQGHTISDTPVKTGFLQKIKPVRNLQGKLALGTVGTAGLVAGATLLGLGMMTVGGAAFSLVGGGIGTIKTHFKSCNSQLKDADQFLKSINLTSVFNNNTTTHVLRLNDPTKAADVAMKPWGRFWPAKFGGHISNEVLLHKMNTELASIIHEHRNKGNTQPLSAEQVRKFAVEASLNITHQQFSKSLLVKTGVSLVAYTAAGAALGSIIPGAGSLAGGIIGFGVGILNMFTSYQKMKYDLTQLKKALTEQLQAPEGQRHATYMSIISQSMLDTSRASQSTEGTHFTDLSAIPESQLYDSPRDFLFTDEQFSQRQSYVPSYEPSVTTSFEENSSESATSRLSQPQIQRSQSEPIAPWHHEMLLDPKVLFDDVDNLSVISRQTSAPASMQNRSSMLNHSSVDVARFSFMTDHPRSIVIVNQTGTGSDQDPLSPLFEANSPTSSAPKSQPQTPVVKRPESIKPLNIAQEFPWAKQYYAKESAIQFDGAGSDAELTIAHNQQMPTTQI